ncbi:ACTI [Symbiodinium natans]|uniref:ACTI protein n=1 Tax=Symbiodinium natans TaxID=878477 RepID=A0A812MQZ5_9DINO|nr:ACTI [Symbiodinium natans]
MLQRMPAAKMIMYFLDMHADLPHPSQAELTSTLSQAETAEIVLHETVKKLLRLGIACKQCPVPQKWIGSSVALGYDVGQLPTRENAEEQLRKQTIVSIFDWGRSELNTIQKHGALSDSAQADRAQYWSYYTGGIYRLGWEVFPPFIRKSLLHPEDPYIGEEAQAPQRACGPATSPFDFRTGSWADVEMMWAYIFYQELRVAPEDHALLVTEAPLNQPADRERLVQLMFEYFNVRALYLALPEVLSLYASGRTAGARSTCDQE